MATWGLGLRAKAMLALALACLLAVVPAGLIGWRVLGSARDHFGQAYVVNFTLLKRQQILAPVSRELALARRLAGSVLTRQWMLAENDPQKRALFFAEAESYRKDLFEQTYFFASALSRHYYTNDRHLPYSEAPRYTLEPTRAEDSWFFSTLRQPSTSNINVDQNAHLGVVRVWLNVGVYDGTRKIGIAGTGIDLSAFTNDFIATREAGFTPMILGDDGAIQAHRNRSLIATNLAGHRASVQQTLAGHLQNAADRSALAAAMARARAEPSTVATLKVNLDGRQQFLALGYIPELKWFIATAVDLNAAQVINRDWLHMAIAALALLTIVLLLSFAYAVERLVLRPLGKLQTSATALAGGQFDVSLPPPSRDELGDLSRAFGVMAEQLRNNTEELERKVRQRTQELEDANRDIRRANQKISDSIDYASLIQRAILPDQKLKQWLGPRHFVLWRPRDVVGGDFYVFRAEGAQYLIGVADCAGHGVPGALMTMLARSALEISMDQAGIGAPAEILSLTDSNMRAMLQQSELPRAIATNMDAGLAWVDSEARILRFSGAKIGLYWSDGVEVGEIKGGRRAIGDRHRGSYESTEVALRPGATYYLATDGFLDQAGGDQGFSLGNSHFARLLQRNARLPMAEQAAALDRALDAYRGEYQQRDDITILSFRFN
jgi:serine phosphatase RsbU (regulator of sigma subunit)